MNVSEPGPHLDHFLRQTRMHHVQLSAMADVKANMMLTLSSLVITFAIRYLSDPYLRWPILTLILFCLITIVASAYAVMPKLNFKDRPDLTHPNCNILFFGCFMNLDYEEFLQVMENIMSDPGNTYEAQVREVYELGVFLGHIKYRYVRLAYTAFITGLLVSALVFVLVEAMNVSPSLLDTLLS